MEERKDRRAARSAEEWSQLVAEWRRSGLTGEAFARLHDVGRTSLYWWASELKRRGEGGDPEKRFVEVDVVGMSDRASMPGEVGRMEVVARSGRVIRLLGRVDAEELALVLGVAERC